MLVVSSGATCKIKKNTRYRLALLVAVMYGIKHSRSTSILIINTLLQYFPEKNERKHPLGSRDYDVQLSHTSPIPLTRVDADEYTP